MNMPILLFLRNIFERDAKCSVANSGYQTSGKKSFSEIRYSNNRIKNIVINRVRLAGKRNY